MTGEAWTRSRSSAFAPSPSCSSPTRSSNAVRGSRWPSPHPARSARPTASCRVPGRSGSSRASGPWSRWRSGDGSADVAESGSAGYRGVIARSIVATATSMSKDFASISSSPNGQAALIESPRRPISSTKRRTALWASTQTSSRSMSCRMPGENDRRADDWKLLVSWYQCPASRRSGRRGA